MNAPPSAPREEVRVDVEGRTLVLSNLDKVLYPATGTTKAEVLQYYAQVAPALLAQLRGRCVTRIRWPHGVGGPSFFEKNVAAGAPSWVRTARVPTTGSRARSGGGPGGGPQGEDTLLFPIVEDLATLTWLGNLAALELHAHQWRVDAHGHPAGADRMVVDLDPGPPAGLEECCAVALRVRDALAARDLATRPVLSGSKGLHLYADLPAPRPGQEVADLARAIAEDLARATPREVTATMTRSRREGRVLLDWSQNATSKTTVSPYSLRGRDRPRVAAPVSWAEVEAGVEGGLDQLGPQEVLQRLSEQGDLLA